MRIKTVAILLAITLGLYLIVSLVLPERFVVNMPIKLLQLPVEQDKFLRNFSLPEEFVTTIFARDLGRVRLMHLTSHGDVLATLPKDGQVVLLKGDRNGDGVNDGKTVLLDHLKLPHGIDLYDGWLYIAEINAVGRIRFDATKAKISGNYQRIVEGLPEKGNHWTRSLRIGPDGFLYLSIGSSCNVCIEDDKRRAAILRFNLDGSGEELFATGLRNSVGLDWSPVDGGLYATDNGRDLLGDDFPPDELNRIVDGGFYGWPFANSNKLPDPDLGDRGGQAIERSINPVHEFKAHNAPLGIRFLRSDSLPNGYKYAALVALHGSWNRSKKDGYKVVSLHRNMGGGFIERDFMTGFEKDESVIGRPVDIVESKEGVIYISDDFAGVVYRITHKIQ